MAAKKDGTLRFCVDYRYLNSVTIKDAYQCRESRTASIALENENAKIFSACDLCLGYYCIPIEESDREKTAFHGLKEELINSQNAIWSHRSSWNVLSSNEQTR